MTALPPPAPIREVEGLTRAAFDAEIRPGAEPVVIRGLGRDWPVVRAARESDEALVAYLKRFSHPNPVNAIVGAPEIEGRFGYTDDLTALNFTRGQSPLDPFLDRLLRDRGAARPYAMAVQSIPAGELVPGFEQENGHDLVDASVVPRLWLGNAIRVATHYDLQENVGVVVAGRRRFTLFPPDQVANLYMGPLELTPAGTPISLVDPADPDLARFPRFADAAKTARTATLEPGDAIYIPFHWWHAVDSLGPINILMNWWWSPAAAPEAGAYDALLFALLALGSLPADQRAAWRTMFDHLVFRTGGQPAEHLPAEVRGVLGEIDAEKAGRIRATLLHQLAQST
ncbi:peptidylprolyl isomerase [Sphingomonas spermidinifaciens]|uniref:Peptidylprolyl isomerase n=1 Tax=Sphingomonas spermidinifaciens TaxID=1141889 RepID=A0A2A4B4I4_9SPHN|nr:cupin-like domain-containing protein [Sphingomonas spermidinifaciens]PCD02699.1 peptidylprolyl isomerase [Sphingomonas spermidinifaciens]